MEDMEDGSIVYLGSIVQPKVKEISPGEFDIDTEELGQFYAGMDAAKDQWDATMAGAEMDPDEIMRRMFKMFGEQ